MQIRDVLAAKPRDGVVTISPEATVRDLLALLARSNIGACVVSADGQQVQGIVSERDVVRGLVEREELLGQPVSAIMTSEVRTISPSDQLHPVHGLMTEGRFRHLPVTEDGVLVGIISVGDVVKSHIAEVEFERDQLDSYMRQ